MNVANPKAALGAEFLELIKGAKAYLMFRQGISPCDLDISRQSLDIVRSWNLAAKTAEPQGSKRVAPGLRGEGDPNAELFIVTEQSQRGVSPYAGDAGELFLKILGAIDLTREKVYITALPASGPMTGALERIKREINRVNPTVICTLGGRAAQAMLDRRDPLQELRGRFHDFNTIPLMPTFHPKTLIHDVARKRPVWEDMKMIKARLGS
ncbi:predicted phage SPO1 DNA polymerase-related protein [Desulforapulum autotrophicum HRM2]|uniref:Predicted phage SPO1 DNA polymerase-related protein n=1 Tax=Desulforapulum autotrophicum (strain ATCC 43914 / DSM 3382 / VKM B-1955 / HRM2) TaxID=177437 RepID=C0QJ39_DESAH|nr:uracil-DNA glycosylase [Desulforapulum autotrophicum]ACN15852.1 predicted phage SPO1 DNA polymerase-related protein [Desulforapulum autotrophicum HRM2]